MFDDEALARRHAARVARVMARAPELARTQLGISAALVDTDPLAGLAERAHVRVGVVGDTHGHAGWLRKIVNTMAAHHADVVVVVGDFGFWAHEGEGRQFLDHVNARAAHAGIPVVFVDGNHENHDLLGRLARRPDGSASVRSHIVHAARGWRARWAGVTVAALGGAASTDRFGRKPRVAGYDWWPEERLTQRDVARLAAGGTVDVLFTHDAPASALVPVDHDRADDPDTLENRRLVQSAVVATHPGLVVHGHHHVRYSGEAAWIDRNASQVSGELVWQSARVEGLACEGTQWRNWAFVDLGGGRWAFSDGRAAEVWAARQRSPWPSPLSSPG